MAALAVVLVLLGGLGIGLWQSRTTQSNTASETQIQARPQSPPQDSAVALPPLDPPAAVEGATPPANPAPPGRQAPVAAPAPPAQAPAAAPAPTPPKVVGQLVIPSPIHKAGCSGDRASVIAKVSSDGEPPAVSLISRGPNGASKTVPMAKVGDGWLAALGPYAAVGTVTWMVAVTDAHGVTATGPISTLPVVSC